LLRKSESHNEILRGRFVVGRGHHVGNCQTNGSQPDASRQPVPAPVPSGFSDTPPKCHPSINLRLTPGTAVLRSGITIAYERRQIIGSKTRLFMSGDLCSDFSTSEIVLLKNRPLSRSSQRSVTTHRTKRASQRLPKQRMAQLFRLLCRIRRDIQSPRVVAFS
jgi:hypothetical protein